MKTTARDLQNKSSILYGVDTYFGQPVIPHLLMDALKNPTEENINTYKELTEEIFETFNFMNGTPYSGYSIKDIEEKIDKCRSLLNLTFCDNEIGYLGFY